MFNNANVLFKTRFIDGSSTVTRHAQRQINNKQDENSVSVFHDQSKSSFNHVNLSSV